MKWFLIFSGLFLIIINVCCTQTSAKFQSAAASDESRIIPGAERMEQYLLLLKGKRVAVFANHTSMAGNAHLVDTLVKSGVNITIIFAPEHGFRGTADAGEKIDNITDPATGIPVISLYGKKENHLKRILKMLM